MSLEHSHIKDLILIHRSPKWQAPTFRVLGVERGGSTRTNEKVRQHNIIIRIMHELKIDEKYAMTFNCNVYLL